MAKMTKKKIEKLATEIRDFMLDRELWIDTRIYFNGKAFATDDGNGHYAYNDPNNLFVLEDIDPHTYTKYAGDILTMTFEGPLYDMINYGDWPKAMERFNAILDKYGVWYELGEAWNLTLYEK